MSPDVLHVLVAVVVGGLLGLASEAVRHRSNPSRLLLQSAITMVFILVFLVPHFYLELAFWPPLIAATASAYAAGLGLRWVRRDRPRHRASRHDRRAATPVSDPVRK